MPALATQTGGSRRVRAIAQAMRCACAGEASDAAQLQQAAAGAAATQARSAEEAALRDRLLAADRRRQPQAMADFAEPSQLQTGEREQFRQAGFLLLESFIKDASVRALCQTLDAVTEGNTLAAHSQRNVEMEPSQAEHSGFVRRVYEPCTRYAPYQAFAESPLLLGVVAQLLGSDDLMYHYSKVNMKPPQVDTIVDWQCAALYPPASTSCPPYASLHAHALRAYASLPALQSRPLVLPAHEQILGRRPALPRRCRRTERCASCRTARPERTGCAARPRLL
jgi:hypothetical protein